MVSAFRDTVPSFIPVDVHERTFGRAGFERFLIRETDRLLANTARQLGSSRGVEDDRI